MAEEAAAPQSSTIEQWLEHEFEQVLGGEHLVEQLRKDLHERYADDPAVCRIIDRIAARTHQRLRQAATP